MQGKVKARRRQHFTGLPASSLGNDVAMAALYINDGVSQQHHRFALENVRQ